VPLSDLPSDSFDARRLVRLFINSLSARLNGLNKSLVNSNISEPMAEIAEAYFSLRNRDSETINSAKMRTRSSSVSAAASFFANSLCRCIASRLNGDNGDCFELP
jgi:hypothetical protein